MNSNPLINFLVETFKRFMAKSPKFFKVWKIILGIPVLIIAIPNALTILNIHLPQIFNDHVTQIVSWATTAAFIFSFLPTDSPVVEVKDGELLKKTDPAKLPFTAAVEKKEIEK